MTAADFRPIVAERYQRPLLILDLAIPRDFDPAIGDLTGVYLYSIDDLKAACERNRREREKEWPEAERIIEEETRRFMADLHHRATAPTIRRLKARADEVKAEELARLLNKLGNVDPKTRERDHRRRSTGWSTSCCTRRWNRSATKPSRARRTACLEALKRLFQLKD